MTRILIACETSGVLRRAFLVRGHDAWSCDILPSEDGSNRHIIADARDLLHDGWDLLMVAHPPCTRLCRAGQRWLYGPGKSHPKQLPAGRTWASMIAEFEEGVALFRALWDAPIERVALENPQMHIHAMERLADLPKAQITQPWWFGEPFFKATGFTRRNLPPLRPTKLLCPPQSGTQEYKDWSAVHRASPGPERWKDRSRTYPGVAKAIADQWGE